MQAATVEEYLSPEMLLRLERYVRGKCLGNVDPAQVYSNTLLRIFDGFDTFQGGRFQAWAFRIAHNEWVRQVQAVTRPHTMHGDGVERLDGLGYEPVTGDDVDFRAVDGDMLVSQALSLLPPVHRACFVLSMDGFTHREIAEQLGMSHANVKKCTQRARDRLRAEYGSGWGVL